MFEYEFSKVDFVTEPGEFSIRGGIVDIFSFSNDKPYRVEFFGDEIESIRTFDIETQLSTGSPIKIQIVPNIEQKLKNEKRVNFLDYINNETQLWIQNINSLINSTNLLNLKAAITFKNLSGPLNYPSPKDLFCTSEDFVKHIENLSLIEFGSDIFFNNGSNGQEVNASPQPSFNKQFNLLIQELNSNHSKGYKNYICCANSQQAKRFFDVFEDHDSVVHYRLLFYLSTQVL